jgi:hypothetical protein
MLYILTKSRAPITIKWAASLNPGAIVRFTRTTTAAGVGHAGDRNPAHDAAFRAASNTLS